MADGREKRDDSMRRERKRRVLGLKTKDEALLVGA
jgi:hypothetical protein